MILTARWVLPVTSPALQNHAVEIADGRIQRIRPIRESDPPSGDTCLIPGLINTHTHLAYTALRNVLDPLPFFPWVRKLTEIKYARLTDEDVIRSTQLGVYECLRSGITSVADMSDLESSLKVLSESALRGNFYWEIFGVEKEAAELTWTGLQRQHQRLKHKYSQERLQIGISPHACYTVRPELYTRVATWAMHEQVPVSFHVSESLEEENFIANQKGVIADFLRERAADWRILGKTSIQHLQKTGIFETKPLLAHVVQACEEDLEILFSTGAMVAHCPKSNAKFGHGIAPVRDMMAKGICVTLGTDSAASNNRLDLFEEGRFALLQQRLRYQKTVLSEQKILEMLTIDGARALRMEDKVGSIEPGKLADLAVVKIPGYYHSGEQVLNHVIHNTSASDVVKTFIAGKQAHVVEPDVSDIYRKLSVPGF